MMAVPTAIDAAVGTGNTLPLGSLQRARRMAALREQGWSLDEIALRFDVSRERVRQILRAHGGPAPHDVVEARRRRVEQQTEARIDELLALWRSGEELRSAANALGLQATASRSAIARFATAVDRAARKASLASARALATTYSDRDIVVALTSAATRMGRVPTAKEYRALARELEYPSLPTVLNRMGGWTSAVRAAGLTPTSAPVRTRSRSRRWTVEACWAAVRQVVDELGEIPTVAGYDRHAAGRTDLPSSATLRNRLGRWSTMTTQLAAERDSPYATVQRPQAASAADQPAAA
ncbi:MAG: homing endonuclease associated repeat-containing protein [Solirubrobacteraceae bacterium]